MSNFTPGQQQAIATLDRNLLVKAGAGAGKTRVLVERYVNILAGGTADVEEIVAITFTRKAAREMKERVRDRVHRLMTEVEDSSNWRRWREIEQRLDHAPISTIHSLCSRILREYPAEASVDPEFALMEEVDETCLLAEIWQEILNKAAKNGEPWLKKLLELYAPAQLRQEFLPLFKKIHGLGLIGPEMGPDLWPELTGQLEQAGDRLKQAYLNMFEWIPESGKMNGTQTKLAEIRAEWDHIEARIEQAVNNPEILAELETRCKGLRGSGEMSEVLRRRKEAAQHYHGVLLDLQIQRIVPELCEWFCQVGQSWSKAKLQRGVLTYDDLESGAEKLLRASPKVCERFRQRIRFIMVDECQDINERQRRIIYLLAGGTAGELRGNKLFVVGDIKQSIYRFRGADNRVFARVEADIVRGGGKVIELLENFRSHRSLVGAFNDFFQILMPATVCEDEAEGADQVEYKNLIGTRGEERQAQVEMWVLDAAMLGGEDSKAKEAEMIADRIGSLVADPAQAVKFRDIVLLLRAFTHVNLYEAAFASAGIPYYVVGGRGFINRQEVSDALELIRFLANPYNEMALFAALRSPFFQLSDSALLCLARAGAAEGIWGGLSRSVTGAVEGLTEQEAEAALQAKTLLDRWLSRRGFLSPAQLLQEAFKATGFDWLQLAQFMGDRRYANLLKLLNMARSFADSGGRSLEGFLTYVELRAAEEGEAEIDSETGDTVRIMTIHKAKGLEFPIVIVPDLQRRFNLRNRLALFLPGLGLGLKLPDEQGKLIESARFRRIARQDAAMEKAELKRLLYVAMTRAESQVVLSAVVDNPKTEKRFQNSTGWLDWTRSLLGLTGPIQEWPEELLLGGARVRIQRDHARNIPADGLTVQQEGCGQTTADRSDIMQNIAPIAAEPGRPKVLSPAYLNEYITCPRRYFYAHICRIPEPAGGRNRGAALAQVPALGVSAQDIGTTFHRFLELMTDPKPWQQSMEQALQEKIAPALWDKAMRMLGPWAEKYAASLLYRELCSVIDERREWSFQYRVLAADRQLPAVWLSGQVDRVLVYPDGTLGIVDYKTDWVEPGSVQKKAIRYQMQIQGYALAVEAVFGKPLRDARLYFARTGETVDIDIASQSLNRTRQQLQDIAGFVRSHDREDDYSCRTDQCLECAFRTICLQE